MAKSWLVKALRITSPGGIAEVAVRGGRIASVEEPSDPIIEAQLQMLIRAAKVSTGARKTRLEAIIKKVQAAKTKRMDDGDLSMLAEAERHAVGAKKRLYGKILERARKKR